MLMFCLIEYQFRKRPRNSYSSSKRFWTVEGSTIDSQHFLNGLFNFVARPGQCWKDLSLSAEIYFMFGLSL